MSFNCGSHSPRLRGLAVIDQLGDVVIVVVVDIFIYMAVNQMFASCMFLVGVDDVAIEFGGDFFLC